MQLPEKLINSLATIPGFEKEAFESIHYSGEQVTSVRFNQTKIAIENPEHTDVSNFPIADCRLPIADSRLPIADSRFTPHDPVPWCTQAYYLNERPVFTLDPLFHAGAYYVQEASSMFLDYALRQLLAGTASLKVLDLCAAPGGKTTLMASLPFFKLIVANEIIKSRVSILYENVVKWGSPRIVITNHDPIAIGRIAGFFDVLVIDAPCSGSGLFRKDPASIIEWSEKNVVLCSERQQRILADALPSLKKYGFLIYSTCSFSVEENENILDWVCENFRLETERIAYPVEWGIQETNSDRHHAWGYRFYPNRVKGEGFFIACLRKKNEEKEVWPPTVKKADHAKKDEKEIIAKWINHAAQFKFFKSKDQFLAIPENICDDYLQLQSVLSVRRKGIQVGKIIRGELIPNHELALSTIIGADLPFTELKLEQALQYLRKQGFSLDNSPAGWVLARYRGLNLGWVKVMANRINNNYPSSWRIRNL